VTRDGRVSQRRAAGILDEMMAECRRYIGSEFWMCLKHVAEKFSERPDAWSLRVSDQTLTWFSFVIQLQSRRILITFLLRSCLSWVHTRNLCRMIALRSVHSPAEEFPNVVADGDVAVSRCSRSGPFGRRQQFFMRNTTARRRDQSPTAIRVIIMMLPCWPRADPSGRSGRPGPANASCET